MGYGIRSCFDRSENVLDADTQLAIRGSKALRRVKNRVCTVNGS